MAKSDIFKVHLEGEIARVASKLSFKSLILDKRKILVTQSKKLPNGHGSLNCILINKFKYERKA